MSTVLVIEGPCPEWVELAVRGRWIDGAIDRSVVVLRGPSEANQASFDRARVEAVPWVELPPTPGVLPLLAVRRVDDRIGWIYPSGAGISVIHLVRADERTRPGARAAAELVAAVARVVRGTPHPGPEPQDVWIDAEGGVRVSGFVAPYPVSPELRAPVASIGEAGQVYRLGVLLARLLVGRTFAPGADAPHHESLLRRLAIRAMSRPGPPLPERLRNYLLAMLSWDPGQRPPLSAIASALDEAGGEGDSLLVWADREVPRRMIDLAAEPVAPDVPPVDEISLILPDDVSSEEHEGTLPRPGAVELDEDDRTAESVVGEGTARPARERGIMPVDVGPPAAIAARRPRLPRGVVAAEARSSTEPGRNVGVERLVAVLVLGSLFLAGAYGVFLFVALGEAR